MTVTVERIDPMSEVGRTLFQGSSAEQIARYGRDGGRKLEALADPNVVFVAALLNGTPVGCGAVVPLEADTGELSRIYVAAEARRNLVTRGIDLNALVGREFTIGSVRAFGQRLCEPCVHLQRLTRPGVIAGLVHQGGLRADILTDGEIRLGDKIEAGSQSSS